MSTKVEKAIRYTNRIPIDSVPVLRGIVGKEPNDYVIVLGSARKADGDAREYYWDGTSTSYDDNDSVIRPTAIDQSNPGRWHKVINSATASNSFKGYKATIIGNGSSSTFYLLHNFNTYDVVVEVYKDDTDEDWIIAETVDTGVNRSLSGVSIIFKERIPQVDEKFRVLILTF